MKIMTMKLGLSLKALGAFKRFVLPVAASGRLIYDELIPKFETVIRKITGKSDVVLFNSSTTAHEVLFRMRSPETPPNMRQVIFQANCFPSVVFAAVRAGWEPYFADVTEDGQIDLASVEKICELVPSAAVLHVTSIGGCVPKHVAAIMRFAKGRSMTLVEDMAHSFAAYRMGTPEDWWLPVFAGSWADYSVMSFSPTKPMTTGGGGAIVLNGPDFAERCAQYGRYGKEARFGNSTFAVPGISSLFSELSAAYGLACWSDYDDLRQARRVVADAYDEGLASVDGLMRVDLGAGTWYKYIVRQKSLAYSELVRLLADHDVPVATRVYDMPAYQDCIQAGLTLPQGSLGILTEACPGAEAWVSEHVCLPIHHEMTKEMIEKVIGALRVCI